jgi:DNA-binding response OmpR family regulator
MLHILLVSARQEAVRAFAEGLSSDPEVHLDQVSSGAEALQTLRSTSPQLAVIDSALPDTEPLPLVQKLLKVNAMINMAVFTTLSDEEFHEVSEGLGILAHLPLRSGKSDAVELLHKLRQILGFSRGSDRPA